jgi:ATP-dependent Zn protease
MLTPNGILSRLRFILAGRAAEEVALGVPSTGAGGSPDSDLAKATGLAVTALCALGMRQGEHALVWQGLHGLDRIPAVLAAHPSIAREVAELLDTAYAQAADMLRRNRALLDDLVQALLASEILGADVVNAIVSRHRAADAEHVESPANALVRD